MHTSRSVFCALLSLVLLSGCATGKYGEQITTVSYYPRCYAPIQDLRDADSSENKTVIAGGVLGALAGALVGYAATGRAEGAVIGAGVGGVAGTGLGYAKAKQDRIADDNRRMASYLVDIDGDISGMDRATAAARVARDCYEKEFHQAVAMFKNKTISREELNRRYQEIKDGTTEAERVLGAMVASTGEREQQYQEAITEEAKKTNQPVPVVRTASSASSADAVGGTPGGTSGARSGKSASGSAKSSTAKNPEASSTTTTAAASSGVTTKKTSTTIKKTPAPQKGDNSLQAVAQNTQRLNESKRAAEEEQAKIREMQAEMDGTLATLTS